MVVYVIIQIKQNKIGEWREIGYLQFQFSSRGSPIFFKIITHAGQLVDITGENGGVPEYVGKQQLVDEAQY